MHLFAGAIEAFEEEYANEETTKPVHHLEERLAKVEEELAELRSAFEALMKELS